MKLMIDIIIRKIKLILLRHKYIRDQRFKSSTSRILLISHELSETGAPRMLLYAAICLKEQGAYVAILSPKNGRLAPEIRRAGIPIFLDRSIKKSAERSIAFEMARDFDTVVVNTIALQDCLKKISKIPCTKFVWWLHESQPLRQLAPFSHSFDHVTQLYVSRYAFEFSPLGSASHHILPNAIPDISSTIIPRKSSRLTFLVSGTIEPNKGFDTFIKAVQVIPVNIRNDCFFVLCGPTPEYQKTYWHALLEEIKCFPEIEYKGALSHQSQLQAIADADVVVCPSCDESFSLVLAEAAMLSKAVISSTHVGANEFFLNGALLEFPAGSHQALAEKMIFFYQNRGFLDSASIKSRESFVRNFSIEVFRDRLAEILM